MAEATTAPRTLPQILRRGAIALVALLMVTGILLLGRTVRTELKELATTGSDNIEWSLSQAEVEAIAFSQEALIAARAPSVPLDLVRLRFDLLYSRVVVLQQGSVFAAMRTDPQVAEHLTKVQSFLDETATLVDGPDAQLRAALPRLSSGSDAVRSDLRDIALQGIAHFSQTSDTQREEVARTLRELALLTLGLVVLLGVTVLALMRLNTVNHRVAETEHATRARLEAILTTALDAVIVTDERGALRGGNPAAERMFGYPRAILLTRTLTDLMAPGALPDGLAPLSGCWPDRERGAPQRRNHVSHRAVGFERHGAQRHTDLCRLRAQHRRACRRRCRAAPIARHRARRRKIQGGASGGDEPRDAHAAERSARHARSHAARGTE